VVVIVADVEQVDHPGARTSLNINAIPSGTPRAHVGVVIAVGAVASFVAAMIVGIEDASTDSDVQRHPEGCDSAPTRRDSAAVWTWVRWTTWRGDLVLHAIGAGGSTEDQLTAELAATSSSARGRQPAPTHPATAARAG